MYIPKIFKQENPSEIKAFIEKNGFASLISQVEGKPWATHIPLVWEEKNGKSVLAGHISRGNAQWRAFTDQEQVMAIFMGPHAYVSSSWYNHENVPTWNYMAVHVYGNVRLTEGEELLASLKKLTDKYEQHSQNPVSVEGMSEKFLRNELKGLVGIEITITDIHAVHKLSQNRDTHNQQNIIAELEKTSDAGAHQIAQEMKKIL
ncbi:FMN-binding negative transcriptional regulator [Cytophagales bacterium LB-30]|uniref:FMN-binding negative transcriptional regulator n=1 Tax=Shiella aurantiaca TaxID=3058365 RepID=A0ABT8F7C7_9BACT|nr:FMN-binding negative transcriptional regulator [Shiella aurantiaca]MDN4166188.1 FMN-binding negative transcriptional regulator [Shiella aurantiaca]